MPNSRRRNTSRTPQRPLKTTGWFRARWVEIGTLAAFVVVLLYVISVSVRVSTGVSRTLDGPRYQVRLQILNGCGVPGLAGRLADRLADYRDEDLEIRVLDTDNFEVRQVSETFLISRDEDLGPARLLAGKLGLEPDRVQYATLENNYRQISATLVLGEDWERLHLPGDSAAN
jgi:hypothetical protein